MSELYRLDADCGCDTRTEGHIAGCFLPVEPVGRVEVYTINVTKNIEFDLCDPFTETPDGYYMLVGVDDVLL